jgi:hypothetical protein
MIAAAALTALLLAPPAGAAFHLLKIREVFAGGNASYIELQQPSANENLVTNHPYNVYGPTGDVVDTFAAGASAGSGQNQRTILYGDTGVEAMFGVEPDFTDTDLSDISAGGGAVCWADGQPPDCVSWGSFTGTLPAPGAGTPVPGAIPAGTAIRRSIAAGCSTLLEATDDTNDSAADFDLVDPAPRSNSQAPIDMPCPTPPNTTINSKPPSATNSTTASFTYSSSQQGSTFECRIDGAAAFTTCPNAGITYMDLMNGQHAFRVRAVGVAGPDPTPAMYTWTVDTSLPPPVPETTIDGGPGGRTKDRTPTFRFSSDPAADSYQCKIDSKPYKSCSSPYTTAKLSFGKHTLRVRGVGAGGTEQTPAKRSFKVIRKR